MLQLCRLQKTVTFSTFEELGLIDPSNSNKTKVAKMVDAIRIDKPIYKEEFGDLPPKCVFVPDKALMRKIIR
jgi:hypothetical protein